MANTNQKKKKSAKQTKVLVASIILAGVIAAGGTFAWFSSQDEVTNKLSASNSYGVSITESFTPPSSWKPGEEVNKDVSVVNTGNVDAFVQVNVTNTLDLVTIDKTGEVYSAANVSKYVTLTEGERTAVQAGGFLAYTTATGVTTGNVGSDTNEFTPTASGYYIFRRDVNVSGNTSTFDYVGYYFDGTNYYQLSETLPTVNSDGDGKITKADGDFTVATKTTTSVTPDLSYDSTNHKIVATYGTGDNAITINVALAEDATTYWQYIDGTTFAYKDDLSAGATSEKLIDSVTLDENVKESAYYQFDYNLKVTLDSVQVTTTDGKETNESVNPWTVDTKDLYGAVTTDEAGEITAVTWSRNSL